MAEYLYQLKVKFFDNPPFVALSKIDSYFEIPGKYCAVSHLEENNGERFFKVLVSSKEDMKLGDFVKDLRKKLDDDLNDFEIISFNRF